MQLNPGDTFSGFSIDLLENAQCQKMLYYNCDDRRISDVQFPGRAGVKRESSKRPTKNPCCESHTTAVSLVLRQ